MKFVFVKPLLYLLFTLLHVSSREIYTCKESTCPLEWIADTWCRWECMDPSCNYDSPDTDSLTVNERFLSSDCAGWCDCDFSKLANGECDEECNGYVCGYDLGDCGYCSSGCTEEMLTNDKCDSECNNWACRFDNNGCGWCAEGCFLEDLSDSVCKAECNNYDCLWDNYACIDSYCSEGCYPDWLWNGRCDDACNNLACDYDSGECSCSIGCNSGVYSEETCRYDSYGVIDDPCAVSSCDFKHGACGNCALGCYNEDLGNGICNEECNNKDCYYDFLDCRCNPYCDAVYDPSTGGLTEPSACWYGCFSSSCQFYGGWCYDIYVSTAIINSIQLGDWDAVYWPDGCWYFWDLYYLEYYGERCEPKSYLDTKECFSCVGLVDIQFPNCLRNNDTHCLICDSVMVMDVCAPKLTTCPLGYQDWYSLGSFFSDTLLICMVEPTNYSPNFYRYFYVDADASPESGYGTGSESDPMKTLNYALVSVYAKFTKIILKNNADHVLENDNLVSSPFILDAIDPLNTINKLKFFEIHILGEDPNNYARVLWKGKMKITPKSVRFYIKNVDFIGNKILRDCEEWYCLYCPHVEVFKDQYVDDRWYDVYYWTYIDMYGRTCSDYNDEILFNFANEVYLENVEFSGFRHEFNTLIKASSIFSLTNVNFSYLQPAAGGSVIDYSCENNCKSADMNFTNGIVTELGFGYEARYSGNIGSFFYGKGYHSVYIKDVDFNWNFAYTNSQSSYPASLFYSEEFLGQIKIIDCNFDYNFVNHLIYIDASLLIYLDYEIVNLVSNAYAQLHFELKNVRFSNTYSSESFFTYLMKKTVQNIEISNVTIEKVTGGNGIFFNIQNSGTLTEIDKVGETRSILLTFDYPTYYYTPPQYVQIVNFTISDVTAGDVMFNIDNIPNLLLENIKIYNVADGYKKNIDDLIDIFSLNSQYLSRHMVPSELPSSKCKQVTSIINIYELSLKNIEIYSTSGTTKSGAAGLFISSIENKASLENINIHDIAGNSTYAIALYISDALLVQVNDLSIQNVIIAMGV